MVKLSPKALRFADLAAASFPVEDPVSLFDAWKRWRGEAGTPQAAETDGRIVVPDPVAAFMLAAIERMITEMRHEIDHADDADGDLGNDLAFLGTVRGAIAAGLER